VATGKERASMNFTELLKGEMEGVYHATFGLLDLVDEDKLDWKPATGENWMTTGQLLMHLTTACGFCCKGFVTGDWGLGSQDSAQGDVSEMSEEDMFPPAAKMPSAETVDQVRDLLTEDKELALAMVDRAGEEDLSTKMSAAPWSPDQEMPLGQHLLHMIEHLSVHKAQLFYYLKLQGKPVHTGLMYGM
jgi:uncharacterized damage-inducible protein DinB